MGFNLFQCLNQRKKKILQQIWFIFLRCLIVLICWLFIKKISFVRPTNKQERHVVLCLQENLVYIPSEADGIVVKPDVNPNQWVTFNGSSHDAKNNKRIFFHETSGHSELSLRQSCAVESSAKHNPDRTIQLFVRPSVNCVPNLIRASPKFFPLQYPAWLKVLSRYPNLSVIFLNEGHYFAGTPLEDWYHKGEWRKSRFHMGHLSDYIRILTLYKGGGMYMDMDIMTLKTFHGVMFNNYLVYENAEMDTVGNSIMHFERGHQLTLELIRILSEEYDPDSYVFHGPDAIAEVMNRVCGLVAGNPYSNKCSDVKILPHRFFHPVAAMFSHMIFQNNTNSVNQEIFHEIKKSFGLHQWNSISLHEKIDLNSNQIFAVLAREHCPLTAFLNDIEWEEIYAQVDSTYQTQRLKDG